MMYVIHQAILIDFERCQRRCRRRPRTEFGNIKFGNDCPEDPSLTSLWTRVASESDKASRKSHNGEDEVVYTNIKEQERSALDVSKPSEIGDRYGNPSYLWC